MAGPFAAGGGYSFGGEAFLGGAGCGRAGAAGPPFAGAALLGGAPLGALVAALPGPLLAASLGGVAGPLDPCQAPGFALAGVVGLGSVAGGGAGKAWGGNLVGVGAPFPPQLPGAAVLAHGFGLGGAEPIAPPMGTPLFLGGCLRGNFGGVPGIGPCGGSPGPVGAGLGNIMGSGFSPPMGFSRLMGSLGSRGDGMGASYDGGGGSSAGKSGSGCGPWCMSILNPYAVEQLSLQNWSLIEVALSDCASGILEVFPAAPADGQGLFCFATTCGSSSLQFRILLESLFNKARMGAHMLHICRCSRVSYRADWASSAAHRCATA